MKKTLAIILVLCMVFSLCACGSSSTTAATTATAAPAATEAPAATTAPTAEPVATEEPASEEIVYQYITVNADGTRTFNDMKGNEVTVPAEEDMDSILTVGWPGNQPTLALLGIQSQIPAWSSTLSGDDLYWAHTYNPDILAKPSVGTEVEEIMNYEPDVVICKTQEVYETLTAAGITAAVMTPKTLDDVLKTVRLTAEISGSKDAMDRADEYIAYYQETVDMIQSRISGISADDYPSIYFVNGQHGDTPLLTDGKGNRLTTFSQICGFKLATDDIGEGDQIEITAEQLLDIDPDIIELYGLSAYDAYDNLMADQSLAGLTALQNGNVTFVPKGGQPMNGTGVENVLYIQWQAKTLYPDLFEDLDIAAVIHDFYLKYMNTDFSDSDIAAMLAGKNSPDA